MNILHHAIALSLMCVTGGDSVPGFELNEAFVNAEVNTNRIEDSSRELEPPKTNHTGTFEGPRIFWNSASGDASAAFIPDGWTLPDITRVEVEGVRDDVVITMTFADDLKRTLSQKERDGKMRGYLVAEMFFDVDDNQQTGEGPSVTPERTGFDVGLEIATGVEVKGKDGSGGAVHGNVSATPQKGQTAKPFVTYDVVTKGASQATGSVELAPSPERAKKACEIRGRKLTIRVPYEELGLKRRQTVRLCFEDSMISAFDEGRVSADAHLKLR